ncbi:hypothetical protein GBF38_010391, partial [Nibea albiflora]
MTKLQVLRALVADRLSAAAEEICSAVERMMAERKMLSTHTEISPEQQRAAVHKRLSLVAEEIFRILEIMMAEYEAEVSGSHNEIGRHRPLLDITLKTETSLHATDKPPLQETSNLEDTLTETDSEFIYVKASHLHQTQRAEKGTSTVMKPGGERCGEPQSDPEVPSSINSEAGSDDNESDEELSEKPNKRKTSQRHGADRCMTCGTSFRKGRKVKKHTRKVAPTSKSQTAGQSCCRVCGKFFRYKRSFLKHVLQHEQSSDLCGACGRHLDSGESLKEHLQSHNEENICREDRRSEAECSEAESKVGDSDEDWKGSEGSESDDRDSEKDETKGGQCAQKPKIQGPNRPKGAKNKDCKDLSHLKYCCKVCGKSFCYRASFLKHVQEDERDADLCGVCGKRFESEESLRLHLQTYIQTNDCEVCGKHFDGHNQLEMHMRTHTGEKPYICTVCGKAFAQNGNLMGHMRVHTGEKPYVCSVCGQSFSFKEYMMAHMRIHTGEKPFLCSVCGKGFRQRGTLKTHMMIHTGESTHRCSVCDKKFYKSGA